MLLTMADLTQEIHLAGFVVRLWKKLQKRVEKKGQVNYLIANMKKVGKKSQVSYRMRKYKKWEKRARSTTG